MISPKGQMARPDVQYHTAHCVQRMEAVGTVVVVLFFILSVSEPKCPDMIAFAFLPSSIPVPCCVRVVRNISFCC